MQVIIQYAFKNNAKRIPAWDTNKKLDNNNMIQQVLTIIAEFILNRTVIVV